MKYISPLLLLMICLHTAYPQPFVNVAQIGYSIQPGYSLEERSEKARFLESNVELNFPVLLKNQDVILLNASRRTVNIEGLDAQNPSKNAAFPGEPYETLTGRLGYRKQWTERIHSTLLVQYRRSGNLMEGVANASQWGGVAIMERKKSDRLSLRVGAYYNQEFFGPFLVPIIGFDYKLSDTWYAYANLPISGTIDHTLNPKFHLGLTYTGIVSSFQLSPAFSNTYIHTSSTDVTLYGEVYLSPQIVLQGKIGRAIGRYFRQYETGDEVKLMVSALGFGDDRLQLNQEVGDGWIAELRLIFRVWK